MKQRSEGQFEGFALCSVLVIVSLLALAPNGKAQVQATTSISGAVSDPNGALVPDATVTIKNEGTGAEQHTQTNASGFYSFPSIVPGTYTVTVTRTGFKAGVVTGRVADVAQPAQVDVTLQLGSTTQTVTVSAAGQELLDTTTAELSGTLNTQMTSSLPLNGGDFMDLASQLPGTSSQNVLGPEKPSSAMQMSFAQTSLNLSSLSAGGVYFTSGIIAGGNRDSAANVSIDGSNVQDAMYNQTQLLISVSDISEVKVESGIMNSEFGFGATSVNVITKNGTNQFHGEAFEFIRNNDFDAANFYTNLLNQPNPPYRMNQFGGSGGGPIIKNKLHFFGNYEGLRLVESLPSQSIVPTAAEHAGNFSGVILQGPNGTGIAGPTIYNPFQYNAATGLRQPFPGNQIPMGSTTLCSPQPTCINPVALAMLNYTPPPNGLLNGVPALIGTTKTNVYTNQYTARLDWDESANDHIFGRYTHYQTQAIAGGLMSLQGSQNPFGVDNPTVSWTRTFSPSIVNDLTLAYERPNWATQRVTGVGNISQQIGLMNTSANPGSPSMSVANYTLNSSLYSDAFDIEDMYQLKDDVSIVRGRHQLKFGFELNEHRVAVSLAGDDKGGFSYNNPMYTADCPLGSTACTGAAGGIPSGGLALADFLLGASPSLTQLRLQGSEGHYNRRYYGWYLQDSWRALPKLTINYGLRYEYWSPWLSPRRINAVWDEATANIVYPLQNPLNFLSPQFHYGETAALTPGVSAAGYATGNKDFAPRLGIAYTLTPNTVIRAGVGVFFDGGGNGEQIMQEAQGTGPFGFNYTVSDGGTTQLPLFFISQQFAVPPPSSIPMPSTTNPVSLQLMGGFHYPTPTIDEWSFSVQRKFGTTGVFELNYFGTHTLHQQIFQNLNPANLPVGPLAGLSTLQRELFPQWGTVECWVNGGWAKYNAVTASFKTPGWHGLTLMSWFSWSRDMVNSAEGYSDEGFLDFRMPNLWAGPSLINPDFRQSNTFRYELPYGAGRRFQAQGKAAELILGNWSLSGTAQFLQGGHQSVYGADTSDTGEVFPMPNRICNPNKVPGGKTRFEYFNTGCFKVPAFATFGNSTLGAIQEPGVNNWDLSLSKGVPILSESRRLEFRADFFNAFNHTQWGYLTNSDTSSTFGQVVEAQNAREIQFSLKFKF